MSLRVAIVGGGTGGHLFPGIAIAEALREKEPSVEILFVSAGTTIESKVLREAILEEYPLNMEKLHRYLTWRLILVPFCLWGALRSSKIVLRKFNPQVVVGMGGYVTGPMGMAAVRLGIPLILCEQNCYPGLSNRRLAKKAKLILSAFSGAKKYFHTLTPFAVIGNPIRAKVRRDLTKQEARKILGLDENLFTLVSVGGSGGARALTKGLLEMLKSWKGDDIQVLAQCRTEDLEKVQGELSQLSQRYHAAGFISDMGALYAAADLAILRAGAGLFEALGRGVTLILVPYPYAAANHQMANANEVEVSGAAVIVEEGEDFGKRLHSRTLELYKNAQKRTQMGIAGKNMGHWNAAGAAAEAILQIGRGQLPDCAELERISVA